MLYNSRYEVCILLVHCVGLILCFCVWEGQTRPLAHWPWGSSVRIKSPPRYSPPRTGKNIAPLSLSLMPCNFPAYSSHFSSFLCVLLLILYPRLSLALSPLLPRYMYYFGGLLSGEIKMNSSPLYLHHVLIPSLPNFQAAGGGQCPTVILYNVM